VAHGEYSGAYVAVALSLFKPFSSRVLNHPPGQRAQRGGSSALPFGPVVAGFSISGQPGD